MSAWQAVVGIAAVGTERQEVTLPPAGGALGRALSRLDLSDREGALLAAVALASLHRRGGFRPAVDPQSAPEACEADEAESREARSQTGGARSREGEAGRPHASARQERREGQAQAVAAGPPLSVGRERAAREWP